MFGHPGIMQAMHLTKRSELKRMCDNESSRLSVLQEREQTHGNYNRLSSTAQKLKSTIRCCMKESGKIREGFQESADPAFESLDMICTKLARIANGNMFEIDHWKDLAGYATLVVEQLEGMHDKCQS